MKFYENFKNYVEQIDNEIHGIEIEMNHGNTSQFTLGKKHTLLSVLRELRKLIDQYVNESMELSKDGELTQEEMAKDPFKHMPRKAYPDLETEPIEKPGPTWVTPLAHDKDDKIPLNNMDEFDIIGRTKGEVIDNQDGTYTHKFTPKDKNKGDEE